MNVGAAPCGSVDMAIMQGLKQGANAPHEYRRWIATVSKYDLWQNTLHKMGQANSYRLDMLAQQDTLHSHPQALAKSKYPG